MTGPLERARRGHAATMVGRVLAVAAVAIPVALAAVTPPAGAAAAIDAKGVALAPTASCTYGDVDITYDARDAQEQAVTFSATGGGVLAERTTKAYKQSYQGTEHVLSQAKAPPTPGTVVAVHVVVGASPLTGTDAAEFTVAYRCDANRDSAGGHNAVVWTCWGDIGACPVSADAALVVAATPGAVQGAASPSVAPAVPAAVPASPVAATPTFSG